MITPSLKPIYMAETSFFISPLPSAIISIKKEWVDAITIHIRREGRAAEWMSMMRSFEGVILMGHQLPDHDAVGGMAGLVAMAAEAGAPVSIAPGRPAEGLQPAIDRLAADGSPVITEIPKNIARCVIIMVDTQRSTFCAHPEWLPLAGGVAVIDHHLPGLNPIKNPILDWLDPKSSSASELVACLLTNARLSPTATQANLMLAGIMLDTRRFSVCATERTFRQASHLCGWGARIDHVSSYFEDRIETYIARSQVVHDAIIEGNMAFSVISVEINGVRVIAAQAADELISLRGIYAAFVACADGDVTVVSVRAREGLSAVSWVSALGGGGTSTAAGLQLSGVTPWRAIELIRSNIGSLQI